LPSIIKFPRDFVWGTAASSFQIEGAAYLDGGGLSIWDMLARQPNKIQHGDNSDIACDHYHRFKEDIAIMSEIGTRAYRFSVSWPRVLADGVGATNKKGLDFYSQLVDALLEKNIQPWLTLFHWDFPYQLYCRGGWLNRDSADWFAEYTSIIVDKLSDRVDHWSTLNEPQCFIDLGHCQGIHAPGLKMGFAEALLAAHHTLLAHGRSVQVIRSQSKLKPFISASQVGRVSIPVDDSEVNIEAAREHMFSIREKSFFNNTWFSDPMILGKYPKDGIELYEKDMPKIMSGDMDIIKQSLDYFGTNIYSGQTIQSLGNSGYEEVIKDDVQFTDMGWPVTPQALYWGPRFFYERYHLPVVITENGMANKDVVVDGAVHDQERINYLSGYLVEYARAIADGIPASGYFLWSIMDNFEWAEGFSKRFGIVHVDYSTQKRTLKDSAFWYQQLIAANDVSNNDSENSE
jgi:beta-glucosidase